MTLTLNEARSWYTETDSVHDFDHIQRVYNLAIKIAQEENADIEIVRAAVLLHDSRDNYAGSKDRKRHHLTSAIFAGEVLAEKGWPQDRIEAVQHCIRAHRFRGNEEKPGSIEAKVLFDADKLDVLGAVGVARTIAYAIVAGQPVYAEPSTLFMETGHKEQEEPHSAYHEYIFKLRKLKDVLFTDAAREFAIDRHEYLQGYFERLIQEIEGNC